MSRSPSAFRVVSWERGLEGLERWCSTPASWQRTRFLRVLSSAKCRCGNADSEVAALFLFPFCVILRRLGGGTSRLLIGSDNERLCCLVSASMWLLFLFFFLEYGRNGKMSLNQHGTEEMPTEHQCLGRLLFSLSTFYFRLWAVKGGFFAGCVRGEPKAVLQTLAGSFRWCRQVCSAQAENIFSKKQCLDVLRLCSCVTGDGGQGEVENRTENGYCYSPLKEKYELLGFEDRLGCLVCSPPDQDCSL